MQMFFVFQSSLSGSVRIFARIFDVHFIFKFIFV